MIHMLRDPLLTPEDTARHLQMPLATLRHWLRDKAAGTPLVHCVEPVTPDAPALPFVAVVEAYVLRCLSELSLTPEQLRDAVGALRSGFTDPYALANRRIADDGVEFFINYADCDELARVGDRRLPLREAVVDYLGCIVWAPAEVYPARLRLRWYAEPASVVIDPEVRSGVPVVERTGLPVQDVVERWRAGESYEAVARRHGLSPAEVAAIVRAAGAEGP
ncbi:DUF433 domain-containing protein [Micromonospora sp. NPDC049679]|uniref:DUF433 domain-containing protein n=1 Tax=Micromonospora sp. NPDC049679 TaxID=3155920 RepID=UPI0033FEA960